MKTKGFTLIELLVVIAIIAVLMGILMPSLKAVREQARGIQCTSNVKSLALAWLLYKDENDDHLVPGDTRINSSSYYPKEPKCWILPRETSFSDDRLEQEKEGIRRGLLYPYVKNIEVYRCPSDRRKHSLTQAHRSYSIAGAAYGETYKNHKTGSVVFARKYSDIKSPAAKYVFLAETDPRGFNGGSWMMHAEKDNHRWTDPLAVWHSRNRTTLGWADGHAQMQRWVDQSTIEMADRAVNAVFRNDTSGGVANGFRMSVPPEEGEDLRFMAGGYPVKSR